MSQPDFQVALSNCDREPVHIPGLIQPFGVMLAFDAAKKRGARLNRVHGSGYLRFVGKRTRRRKGC